MRCSRGGSKTYRGSEIRGTIDAHIVDCGRHACFSIVRLCLFGPSKKTRFPSSGHALPRRFSMQRSKTHSFRDIFEENKQTQRQKYDNGKCWNAHSRNVDEFIKETSKKKNVLAVGVKKRKVGFKENCPGLRGQFLPPNRKGKSLYRH